MARKRGMQFIPYDYEATYNKAMEDMHEWFIENLFQHRKKVIYALKEITAGDQFEIEIYPQFRSMDEVPPEGRTIKKDNNKAQKNLNCNLETRFHALKISGVASLPLLIFPQRWNGEPE